MAKRSQQKKAREKRRRQQKRKSSQILSDADLRQVMVWKKRIDNSIRDALCCHRWIEEGGLQNNKFARMALAKAVENTTDAITNLDEASHGTLLKALVEIPKDGNDRRAMTWKNIKSIRIRLAHKYWDINYDILVTAVRDDFPKLEALFERLHIETAEETGNSSFRFGIETAGKTLEPKTIAADGEPPLPGNSVILATYHFPAGWLLFRLFRREDGSMSCLPLFYGELPDDLVCRFSLYGIRYR